MSTVNVIAVVATIIIAVSVFILIIIWMRDYKKTHRLRSGFVSSRNKEIQDPVPPRQVRILPSAAARARNERSDSDMLNPLSPLNPLHSVFGSHESHGGHFDSGGHDSGGYDGGGSDGGDGD